MSTRSTTHFLDSELSKKPTAIIYRHSDGYPEGAGADLLAFVERCALLPDSRFTDASYLAAKYVVYLAEMFAVNYNHNIPGSDPTPKAERLDFLSVGVCNADPGDIEYCYHVICDGSGANHRPQVKCFKVNYDAKRTRTELDLARELSGKET